MSRYYNIEIYQPGRTEIFRQYTSFPGGRNDPGALDVAFDVFEYSYATPAGQTAVQIQGVSLQEISQASNLNGCTIKIYGGFQKGLPLNNPAQAGLILSGTILQAFGNWIGVDMSLDLVVYGRGALAEAPSNISLTWPAGTPLSQALTTTLTNAFPGVKIAMNISPKLVLQHDEPGYYPSLVGFAQMLKPITQQIIGGDYPGVDIAWSKTSLLVFDGTTEAAAKPIAFQDMIGQPTWINPATIQFACPMRADLSVNDYIEMPKGLFGNVTNPFGAPGAVTTTADAKTQARKFITFTGMFRIVQIHHMGHYRAADGLAWSTVIEAVIRQKAGT